MAAGAALLACAGTVAGCDVLTAVTVYLPRRPATWVGLVLHYEVRYVDRAGVLQQLRAEPGQVLRLPLAHGRAVPALAVPVTAGGLRLRPAGGVYPVTASADGTLQLSWRRGLLAELTLALWHSGAAADLFNLQRLDHEIAAWGPDPWLLDVLGVRAAIDAGRFRVTDLRPLPVQPVTLAVAAGRWMWDDPLRPALSSDGAAVTVALPHGIHLLFAHDGRAWAVAVLADQPALTVTL